MKILFASIFSVFLICVCDVSGSAANSDTLLNLTKLIQDSPTEQDLFVSYIYKTFGNSETSADLLLEIAGAINTQPYDVRINALAALGVLEVVTSQKVPIRARGQLERGVSP